MVQHQWYNTNKQAEAPLADEAHFEDLEIPVVPADKEHAWQREGHPGTLLPMMEGLVLKDVYMVRSFLNVVPYHGSLNDSFHLVSYEYPFKGRFSVRKTTGGRGGSENASGYGAVQRTRRTPAPTVGAGGVD